jgi:hypothetical protein
VRMNSVLKGDSHLIGGVAVEVHDVSAGEVPVGGRRCVLEDEVHSENEECFKWRISPDWGSSC